MAIDVNFLQVLWFVLLTVVLLAYWILDGFDLGIGALYPFLGKTEDERDLMRNAIGPLWDGNEVWLITAGGALFAAFPPAYATTFSGFYLAVMVILYALIFRAVAIAITGSVTRNKKFWEIAFFLGSLIPAILFGVAIGNLMNGVPLTEAGDVAGGFPARFIQLLGAFPILCGLLSLSMSLMQGAGWLAIKTYKGALHDRAVKARNIFIVTTIVLFAAGGAFYLLAIVPGLPEAGALYMIDGLPAVIRVVVAVLAFVALVVALVVFRNRAGFAFIATSAAVAFVIIVMAAALFPSLVPAADPQFTPMAAQNVGETIHIGYPYAASDLSLTVMAIVAAIGIPLVLVYHVIVYRIFSKKITEEGYQDALH